MAARRVFLHIGQGKTGTSTIQAFLVRNRKSLASHGYLYPVISGSSRHLELSLYARTDSEMVNTPSWWRVPWDSPAGLRTAIEKDLPAQIAESGCENIVLSDEALWRLPTAGLATLVEALGPLDELVTVVYLRRQDEHVVSRYKQSVREGRTHLLSDLLARPTTIGAWQYDSTLRNLAATFPSARLVVRPYHSSRFREGSLVDDFLDAIDAADFDYEKGSTESLRFNTSLDAYTTEYLRRWNVTHGRDKTLGQRLKKLADGPDLRFEEDEHKALWEQLRLSNSRLVKEFLPDAEDIFLAPPRSTDAITQREVTDADLARLAARLAASARSQKPKAA
jgi:hypothetical protein